MKLDQLDAALALRDLDLPGNRLEALKGRPEGNVQARPSGAYFSYRGYVKATTNPVPGSSDRMRR
jgi:hypothetical protein